MISRIFFEKGFIMIGLHFGRTLFAAALLSLSISLFANAAPARDYEDYRGYHVLTVLADKPGWMRGPYHSARGAFRLHNIAMTEAGPEILEKPEEMLKYDAVFLGNRPVYTDAQAAGLEKYLASGGTLYATWGVGTNNPRLLKLFGIKQRKSQWLLNIKLDEGFWGKITPDNNVPLNTWWGFRKPMKRDGGTGHEMVTLEPADSGSKVIMWSETDVPLGLVREYPGGGRALLLGITPENNTYYKNGRQITLKMLHKIYAFLFNKPPRKPDFSGQVEVSVPATVEVSSVKVGGKEVKTRFRPEGSVKLAQLDLKNLKPGESAEVVIDFRKTRKGNVLRFITFPNGNHIYFDHPAELIKFVRYMNADSLSSQCRNATGIAFYSKSYPGDRQKLSSYQGDFLKDFYVMAKREGIGTSGFFYQVMNKRPDVQKYTVRLDKDGKPARNGRRYCQLDEKLREHNLNSFRQFTKDYPEVDGLSLDDNFEMEGTFNCCYCKNCLDKFRKAYPGKKPGSHSPEWQKFWADEGEKLLMQLVAIAKEAGKPLGGARQMWVKPGKVHKYLTHHGAMVYEWPALGCSEGIRVLPAFAQYRTILWGMERLDLSDIDPEVRECVFSGASSLGYWLHFYKRNDADNPWNIGMPQEDKEMKLPNGRLMHGTFAAVSKALANTEKHYADYLAQYLLRGDNRCTVTDAVMTDSQLRLTIKNTGKITAPVSCKVDFGGFFK